MNGKVYYPKYLVWLIVGCYCLFVLSLGFIIWGKYKAGIYGLSMVISTPFIAMVIVTIPIFFAIRKITVISKDAFHFRTLFKDNHYSHSDIKEIWIESIPMFGIKDYLRVVMKDGVRIGIIGLYWNGYKELKKYFIENNPGKVKQSDVAWQKVDD